MPRLSIDEISAALSDEDVMLARLLQTAMGAGVALFLFVLAFLYSRAPQASAGDSAVALLAAVLTALAAVGAAAACAVPGLLLEARFKRLDRALLAAPAADYARTLRNFHVIRLALFEGPVLLLLVLCLITVRSGDLKRNPMYWAASFPAIASMSNLPAPDPA